jgi:1,4-alpha-glucan branching enzyme
MLPEDPEKLSRWDAEGAYHWHFGQSLIDVIMDDIAEEKAEHDIWQDFLSALDPARSGYSRPRKMVNYIESHDEERLVKKLRDAGLDGGEARHRAALAAAVLLTAAGEPMLYQAQEWGEKTPMDMDGNPLHWELLGSEGGAGLHEFYRMVIGIRRDHPALRTENFSLEYENSEQQCVVYLRWNDEGDRVLVAANFSPQAHELDIHFPENGGWHEAVSGEDIDVQDVLHVTLHAHAPRIWIKH